MCIESWYSYDALTSPLESRVCMGSVTTHPSVSLIYIHYCVGHDISIQPIDPQVNRPRLFLTSANQTTLHVYPVAQPIPRLGEGPGLGITNYIRSAVVLPTTETSDLLLHVSCSVPNQLAVFCIECTQHKINTVSSI